MSLDPEHIEAAQELLEAWQGDYALAIENAMQAARFFGTTRQPEQKARALVIANYLRGMRTEAGNLPGDLPDALK